MRNIVHTSWAKYRDVPHQVLYVSPLGKPGFLGSSARKESTCNAGDPVSILGSGRSPGEGIGYLLQYSWASLGAKMVKNPPAILETWVQCLVWADPLEKCMAMRSSILAWGIPWTEEPGGYSPWTHKESDMTERLRTTKKASERTVNCNTLNLLL